MTKEFLVRAVDLEKHGISLVFTSDLDKRIETERNSKAIADALSASNAGEAVADERAAFEAWFDAEYPVVSAPELRDELREAKWPAYKAGMARAALASAQTWTPVTDEQIGPVKAWCRVCEAVTPCSWRWNDNACADLCCDDCHNIHVCVHEFSDSDSQRLGALARAVMHDQVYHDTLAARVEELERAALASAQTWQPIETAPKDGSRLIVRSVEIGTCVASECSVGGDGPGWYVVNDIKITPTHWMPLPAAPNTPESKEPK